MEPAERFRSYLRQNSLPFTSARSAILSGIVAARGHFDAEGLRARLARAGTPLSTATIYRALPLFVQSGIIRETLPAGGRARYEPAWGREHHDHLECIRCGKVIEFTHDGLERLQDTVCRAHRFQATEHRLSIRGWCAACLDKA
jgi:Fur family ferric uptake transcriptional regulator